MPDANKKLDDFIARNCHCETCVHAVDFDLFDRAFCEQPGMAGGWNSKDALCEEHDFRNPKLETELQRLLDRWHQQWRKELKAEDPKLYEELYS